MKIENLHDEMCAALESIGGLPPERVREDHPGLKKCDIVFPQESVFVEVKSLASDRSATASVKEKNGRLLHKWANRGMAPVAFGEVNINLGDCGNLSLMTFY